MTYTPCPAEFNGYPCVYEAGHPREHYNRREHLTWGQWARLHTQPPPAA